MNNQLFDTLAFVSDKIRRHDFFDHVDNKPPDPLDIVIEQLELGIPIDRWRVLGNVNRIIARLERRGIYQPHYEDILWDLSDSAKESL